VALFLTDATGASALRRAVVGDRDGRAQCAAASQKMIATGRTRSGRVPGDGGIADQRGQCAGEAADDVLGRGAFEIQREEL
jgi:hypothetical protein